MISTPLTSTSRRNIREAVGQALTLRFLRARSLNDAKHLPESKRSPLISDYRYASLVDLARECLIADGATPEKVRAAGSVDVVQLALGVRGASHNVSGTLADLVVDAVNKTVVAAYDESPQTWRGPMRQALSVPDFKQIHRVKLSAVGNISYWHENDPPNQTALSNEKESYAVEARAEDLSFSWKLLVNDDLDALSRGPAMLGDAAGRTVNAIAWQAITANKNLADGQPLFSAATGNRKRANLITGAATPTVATLGSMKNLMRQMRGLNTPEGEESEDILNLTPRYIVTPSALETTVEQLVNSIADPADNKNSGTFNPARTLTHITEPLLDSTSATAWYLFADPIRVDTAEVTFLQGQETPVVNAWTDPSTLTQHFTVIQTFAAKAIDYRGVVRHDGV